MNKRIKMAAGAGLAALALVVSGGGYYYFHGHARLCAENGQSID